MYKKWYSEKKHVTRSTYRIIPHTAISSGRAPRAKHHKSTYLAQLFSFRHAPHRHSKPSPFYLPKRCRIYTRRGPATSDRLASHLPSTAISRFITPSFSLLPTASIHRSPPDMKKEPRKTTSLLTPREPADVPLQTMR